MRHFDKFLSRDFPMRLALEEIVTGKRRADKEYTFYGRLVDPSELEQAVSKEEQEQWSINVAKVPENGSAGQIRVRKTLKDGGEPEYTQVIKKKGDDTDIGVPITADFFEAVKELADFGMIKTRFIIPIEGSENEWHIDLYPKADGSGFYDWVKVDLELQSIADELPTMPVRLEETITNQYGERTEAEIARIDALMKNEFKAVNPYSAGGSANPQTTLDASAGKTEPSADGSTSDTDDNGKKADDNADASNTGDPAAAGTGTGEAEGGQNPDENKDAAATGDGSTPAEPPADNPDANATPAVDDQSAAGGADDQNQPTT